MKQIAAARDAFEALENRPDSGFVVDPALDGEVNRVREMVEGCNGLVLGNEAERLEQLALALRYDRDAIEPTLLPIFEGAARLLEADA